MSNCSKLKRKVHFTTSSSSDLWLHVCGNYIVISFFLLFLACSINDYILSSWFALQKKKPLATGIPWFTNSNLKLQQTPEKVLMNQIWSFNSCGYMNTIWVFCNWYTFKAVCSILQAYGYNLQHCFLLKTAFILGFWQKKSPLWKIGLLNEYGFA